MDAEGDVEEATAKARQAAKSKQSIRPAHFKHCLRIADALWRQAFAPVYRCAAGALDSDTGQATEEKGVPSLKHPFRPRFHRSVITSPPANFKWRHARASIGNQRSGILPLAIDGHSFYQKICGIGVIDREVSYH